MLVGFCRRKEVTEVESHDGGLYLEGISDRLHPFLVLQGAQKLRGSPDVLSTTADGINYIQIPRQFHSTPIQLLIGSILG